MLVIRLEMVSVLFQEFYRLFQDVFTQVKAQTDILDFFGPSFYSVVACFNVQDLASPLRTLHVSRFENPPDTA